MLERGRTDDQHALGRTAAHQQLCGGDGLDRLAQAHLVAEKPAARTCGKQCALGLVRVELGLEQPTQFRALRAFRVSRIENLLAPRRSATKLRASS